MRISDWSSDVCSSDLARPKFGRFLVYWTVLTLGALVATASLALSTRFFALGIFKTASGQWVEGVLLQLAPMLIELLAFTAIYRVVPHRTSQWRPAIAGAALAVPLLALVNWGNGMYLGSFCGRPEEVGVGRMEGISSK